MITLMIVDDEVGIRKGIKRFIDWNAWNIALVAEASNGTDALQLALKTKPDILLTDIRMPGLNGLELSRQVLQNSPETRIIILTGYNGSEYLQEALNLGVHAYITKPAGSEQIIQAVLKQKTSCWINGLRYSGKKS